MDVLQQLVHLQKRRQPSVLVTLVETRGSTPRKPGARMLVLPDGTTHGTIGGGRVEHAVMQAAEEALREATPRVLSYQLTSELAMCCGGQMKFFVEPVMPRPPLLVFGCGHIGAALLQAASALNLDLVAIVGPCNMMPGIHIYRRTSCFPLNTFLVGGCLHDCEPNAVLLELDDVILP